MQILCRFCLLIFACSFLEVYKRFSAFFLGLLVMDCASFLKCLTESNSDFGCGFLVFGCFPRVFNFLGLFLMFYLGLKFLQFGFHGWGLVQSLCGCVRGKSSDVRSNELCSRIGFGEECDDAKIVSCNCGGGPLMFLESSKLLKIKSKDNVNDDNHDDDERECSEEDQEFDVMVLRRLVKIERQRAISALMELEKERMAAASAANEAMGMILRLQSEKSVIEIEANQYRRMAEQKQDYDKEVIQSLQWIVMKHESERSQLEEKLKACKRKLKQHVNDDDDEIEQFEEFDSSFRIHDGPVSSLDMDSITEW